MTAIIIVICVLLLPPGILIVGLWLYLCKKAYICVREAFVFSDGMFGTPIPPPPPRKSNED